MRPVKAWHFTTGTLRDGRPLPKRGVWLRHEGPVVICDSGLHASRKILDALKWAPGNVIHRVECADIVEESADKLVCRRRRIVASVDGEVILREFARYCARSVLHLWDAPRVVVRYLRTGDESLRAAAWDAAWDAARVAAGAAAGAAAWDAAWDAAGDAARDAQNRWLTRRVLREMK